MDHWSRGRWRRAGAGALLLLLTTGAACSGGGEDADERAEREATEELAATSTVPEQNACSVTSPQDVEGIFGGSVRADVTDVGVCRYEVIDRGEARLSLLRDDPRPITDLVPGGQAIDDLGDIAVWAPGRDGAGVMAVQVGATTVVLDVHLSDGDTDATFGLTTVWARQILERLPDAADAPTTTVAPEDQREALCRRLPEDERDAIFGEEWTLVDDGGDGLCTFTLADDTYVELGPLTTPTTRAALEAVGRTSTVDGVATEWPRETLTIGDGGVLLRDPLDEGHVEVYVLDGATMVRVAVGADGSERARLLAGGIALEVARG